MKTSTHFFIVSCRFLRTRSVSHKSGREKNTRFMFSNFFWKSFRLWDNVEGYCRVGQATGDSVARMRIACWITKARNAHPEYVLLIAFPLQQQLHERASTLHCTYIACLVVCNLTGLQTL